MEKRPRRALLQISAPSDLLDELDATIPKGERSAFVVEAIRSELARRERERIERERQEAMA